MALITFGTRVNTHGALLKTKLEAMVAERARAACEEAGQMAAGMIASEAPQSRDGRHRSKSLSDPSAYEHEVIRQSHGARLVIKIEGDPLFRAKFFSINYGSNGHFIPAAGKRLVFPGTNDRAGTTVGSRTGVNHPGTAGTGFYERGIQRALAAIPRLL